MKKRNKKKYIGSYKNIVTGGLATFLIFGLSGCDGSNESKATKKQKCKLQSYKEQHLEECKDLENYNTNSNTNTNSTTNHNNTSWVPLWLMMNNSNNISNGHSGYTYGSDTSSKSSGYHNSGGSGGSMSSGG